MRAGIEEVVQMSRQCGVKVYSGQLTWREKSRFQPGFPGTFPAQHGLGGQEHDVQRAAGGSGLNQLHDQRDPGQVR